MHIKAILGSLLLLALSTACQQPPPDLSQLPPLLPYPDQLTGTNGPGFEVTSDISIQVPADDAGIQRYGFRTARMFRQRFGFELPIAGDPGPKTIVFKKDSSVEHSEGYRLEVNQNQITLSASAQAGFFYGYQTLSKLIGNAQGTPIPALAIEDAPNFEWRGMHLDVSRHFFPVEDIKKYLDLMARYRFNRFHWHLTDDQGWRIEIKKYPELTAISAFRKETLIGHYNDTPQQFDGKRYGGYYTQEEIREVVRYAAQRQITVIPEIEMPGHSSAVLAAYPELGCTGQAVEVATKWGIFEDVFCPKEETFAFLEDVLTEVIDLFPSEFIHIGGDECPKVQWEASQFCQDLMQKEGLKDEQELQSYFIRRIEQFVNSKGRQIIGWDEILEGGLAPNAAVMSWRGEEGGIEAAKQGHKVVMTPTEYCYLDYYQSQNPDEPLAIGGFTPLEKVYHYEPVPEALSAEEAQYVMGAQANVWTEYMPTFGQVEYMAFPRAIALAEVLWTDADHRNFEDFVQRLTLELEELDSLGINAANHLFEVKTSFIPGPANSIGLEMTTPVEEAIIRYNTDGSFPTLEDPKAERTLMLQASTHLSAQAFFKDQPQGSPIGIQLDWHPWAGAEIALQNAPHPKYGEGGSFALVNGVTGHDSRYGDKEWLGFDGQDLEAILKTHKPVPLTKAHFRFYNGPGQWIYPPASVEIYFSQDGKTYQLAGKGKPAPSAEKIAALQIPLQTSTASYFKVIAKNYGTIPDGRQGAGHGAWLFVDELRVE